MVYAIRRLFGYEAKNVNSVESPGDMEVSGVFHSETASRKTVEVIKMSQLRGSFY